VEWQDELEGRRERFRQLVDEHECDAALVYGAHGHGEHFRYLTNFAPALGDMWFLSHTDAPPLCVLDFDWQLEEARRRSGIDDWRARFGAAPLAAELLAGASPRRLAVAGLDRLPVTAWETVRTGLGPAEIVDLGAELARLRRRKSQLELERLREAAGLTDAALELARSAARPGIPERELAARIGQALGPEWAFPPTVISGNDDPIPIREPTERRLEQGDTVMIDIGAGYEGYQADASRTFVLGEPSELQRRVWDVVLRTYEAALRAVRAGVACRTVHDIAARMAESNGFRLAHRIGHGIGLATSFEWPDLGRDEEPLESGTTICIEPSIATAGAGVMKLEDDLVVTDDGYELLTSSDRSLEAWPAHV
jgi:Xaa-Pro dipeptidase